MALTTGYQLKAARALAGQNQTELAEAAGVNVNTIRKMEARGAQILVSGLDTIHKVQRALERRGVVFLAGDGGPGVQLNDRGDAQNAA